MTEDIIGAYETARKIIFFRLCFSLTRFYAKALCYNLELFHWEL